MAIEYRIVTSPRQDRMEETVTNMLNEGWTFAGSMFISQAGAMAQGMTKEVKQTAAKASDKKQVS